MYGGGITKKTILSKALEANLSRTLDQVEEIPEKQKWFCELSASTWGIHNRSKDFLIELNHKFRNDRHVLELLHSICLEDFWFYNSLENSDEALSVLIDIFEFLFGSVKEKADRDMLVTTLIKFMDRLATQESFSKDIIYRSFAVLEKDIPGHEELYIRNSGYFKTCFDRLAKYEEFLPIVYRLTSNVLSLCFDYWEETTKAEEWFKSKSHLFSVMDAEKIAEIGHPFFAFLRGELKRAGTWEELRNIMFYNDISNYFRSFSKEFESSLETIHYLYYLLHLPGMYYLYDHLLYDINRNLRSVFKEVAAEDISGFLNTVILGLKEMKAEYPRTVLDCIATLGKEVVASRNKQGITYFVDSLIKFGFCYPGDLSINSDWQVHINANHVPNIRVFLELVEADPSSMRELLNALIVELKLGGIFISDTDLFQRDVTKLLNADIAPVYREIKQLTRIFPVFFQQIGAEGKLREITTAIDGLSMRQDRLIHFLRVQVHVESNNTNVDLTRKILEYWYDGNKEPLKKLLEEGLYETLEDDKEWYEKAHEALHTLCRTLSMDLPEVLRLNIETLKSKAESIYNPSDIHLSKVFDMFHIHSLLKEKYSFETENVVDMVKKTSFFSKDDLEKLSSDIHHGRSEQAIKLLYKMMNHLKSVILNPEKAEAFENIEYKRHIAAGIPSTYGRYQEPKFDALGLMYRLERVVSNLMSRALSSLSREYITAKTLRQIYDVLLLFKEGLALDGLYDQSLNSHLEMFKYSLQSPSFSLRQYINIFQFLGQDVSQIIKTYFLNIYERPLTVIIPLILTERGMPAEEQSEEVIQAEREKFFRDVLSSAFLLQELDLFIADTVSILRNMIENYSDEFIENILTYDPDLTFSTLMQSTEKVDNPIFLSAKAFFLKKLSSYGFPVPPGFVITTEVFRHIGPLLGHPYMKQDFEKTIEQYISVIERQTGQVFGNPANPLLFSVRSGSLMSFPGAMLTFLNVGLNDEIAEAWSAKEGFGWTAWDCYRRFLQNWGMSFGIDRDIFDEVMFEHKERVGVTLKVQFTSEQMKRVANNYKKVLLDHNIPLETSPIEQMKTAIKRVLDSWSSESALLYRENRQIANEWGTAVVVQKMVLGNLSENSGTGLVFTSSPLKDFSSISLYGDFAICSQGEDVASGLVNTLPISEAQRREQYNEPLSLESSFPQIYQTLQKYAALLIEKHGFAHQEMEFTFESNRAESLYILQTRNQNVVTPQTHRRFAAPPNKMKLIGHGVGVGGNVLSGVVAFNMEDIQRIKKSSPGKKIILIRPDTVPEDMPMLFACDGLITSKGGVTSHAAVTAVELGKACVVRCEGLQVNDIQKECFINGYRFTEGQPISIDGYRGSVYQGYYDILDK